MCANNNAVSELESLLGMSNVLKCSVEIDSITNQGIETIDFIQRVFDFVILRG